MSKRFFFVSIIACAVMSVFLTISALAQTEKEPNNTPEQANPIHATEMVGGVLQDSFDYFSITLPTTGKTTVTLSCCPPGAQIQIGAKGFGYTGWQDSNGKGTVRLTYDAKKTSGVIWVKPIFAGSVCGSDWCASQFVAGGPFHVTKSSPNIPGSFQDSPILAPQEYSLMVEQASTTHSHKRKAVPAASTAPHAGNTTSVSGYTMKKFKENHFGFSFELPDNWMWELLPDNGGYMLSGSEEDKSNELVIVIQAVKKAANPGSSVSKQLQEAKQQIQGFPDSEIRSEDITEVSGQRVPFFLALYPGRTSQNQPAKFAHVQMILEKGSNYYWFSYAAPIEYFQKYQDVFSNMLATFRFTDVAARSPQMTPFDSKQANARIEIKKFRAGGGSLFNSKVKVRAKGYGSGAKLLTLFAVKANGETMELQSRPCRSGKVVDFNAVYDRLKTKLFELRLYNHENQVIARFQRKA